MKIKHVLMTLALAAATLTATGQTVTTDAGQTYAPADLAANTLANATTLTISGTWTASQVTTLREAIAGSYFGSNTVLTTVTFDPDAVMKSMEYLFRNCTALTGVTMPTAENSAAVNFYYAFNGCTALKGNVNLSGFTAISNMGSAFEGCAVLQGVTMPTAENSAAVSFSNAFNGCKALTGTVNLSAFTAISGMISAFYGCTALEGVTMPATNTPPANGVSFMNAFNGCKALQSVDLSKFTAISSMSSAFYGCTALEGVTLPATNTAPSEGVSFSNAFNGCKALTGTVNLSAFTAISGMISAFYGCTALEGVTMPATNTPPANGVSFMNAFNGCKALQSVNLSKFTAISSMSSAFEGCTALEGVTLPAANTAPSSGISFSGAFQNCAALTGTVDMSGFTNISYMNYAFKGCTGIIGVKFSATENTAAGNFNSAFEGCTALQSVDLSKFTAISDMAFTFLNCTSLTSVKLGGALPATTIGAFDNTNFNCLVYVPVGWGAKPSDWLNITYIAGGTTVGDITLHQDYPFHCPEAFTIGEGNSITYYRYFPKTSGIGGKAAGWETLCLPFTPTEITGTNKNYQGITLVPFNAEGTYAGKGTEGVVPFWLRALTPDSYTPVTTIEPNKPYIIAMPNNPAYDNKYNVVNEMVSFSATATADAPITVKATPEVLPSVTGASYTLHGNYSTVPAAQSMYVINTEGTAFVANGGDARPFRPYVTANNPQNAPAQFVIGEDEGGATAIEEAVLMGYSDGNGASADGLRVYGSTERGALVVEAAGAAASTVDVVAIDGRVVRTVSLQEGVNVVDGLAAGVYVVGGCKAVVR